MNNYNIPKKDFLYKNKITSILRVVHNKENPFVQLNKKALWDDNLSLRATGLWARALSKPDDWHFNMTELIASFKEGRKVVYDAMHEIVKAGYGIRIKVSVKENGKYIDSTVHYVFFEFPATEQDKLDQLEFFKKSFQHSIFGHLTIRDLSNVQLLIHILKEKEDTNKKNKQKKTTEPLPESGIQFIDDPEEIKKESTVSGKPDTEKPPKIPKPKIEPKGSVVGVSKIAFDRKTNNFKGLTDEIKSQLQQIFPSVNLSQELQLMAVWLMEKPKYKGTYAFITKWLKKNQPAIVVNIPAPTIEFDPEIEEIIKKRNEKNKEENERFNN